MPAPSEDENDTTAALAEWAEGFTRAEKCARQVQYRKMKKNEVNKLKQVIHQLELTKATTIARNASSKVNRMLSWKDVAEALLCDRRLAESQHKALAKDQIQNKKHLLEMYQWVLAQVSLQRAPNAMCSTWRNVSLLASPESRSLGKQWITRQMYHNRDRVFQQYGYPSLDTTAPEYIFHVQMTFSENGYTLEYIRQAVSTWSLETFVDYYNQTLLPLQCAVIYFDPTIPLIVNEVEGHTRQYAVVTPNNEYSNVLVGEFHVQDECTFVIQQIQSDEMCDGGTPQRNRMSWEMVRRLPGGGGIVARNVLLLSQLFTAKDGLLSLEEDAKSWGIDLDGTPDHLKEARYPQMFMEVAEREIAKHRAWYIANKQTIHV
ncbi:hypothetical protein H257_16988 [Aphanomyces astaci]|uniref:Uncharacterized protein n=2 Tax=Aphanomyces astaci TaxID=112090 RepID=W4FGD1_APHAT|nr:hypothetical protein H257_16988 [Aphanomyces astaci]ETV66547.1 hypothetical protein H257_16988 [Aphanomyces astaci]|eukprot:XP_009843918.1 hypothetical protein H257_16988 [Aphanomyces astaci]